MSGIMSKFKRKVLPKGNSSYGHSSDSSGRPHTSADSDFAAVGTLLHRDLKRDHDTLSDFKTAFEESRNCLIDRINASGLAVDGDLITRVNKTHNDAQNLCNGLEVMSPWNSAEERARFYEGHDALSVPMKGLNQAVENWDSYVAEHWSGG